MFVKTNKSSVLLLPPRVPRHYLRDVGRTIATGRQRYLTRKNVLVASGISLAVLTVGLTATFFWPRSMNLSFAGNNCLMQPLVLPNLVSQRASSSYRATPQPSLAIAGYPLYSHRTCIAPTQAPQENATETIAYGAGPFTKRIHISTSNFPQLASQLTASTPVSTQQPLVLRLNAADELFAYQLRANNAAHPCSTNGATLSCPTSPLKLAQSSDYEFTLERSFNGQLQHTLFEGQLPTVENVHVASSSIASGQLVYDTPAELTLTLNRPAAQMDGAKLYQLIGDQREEINAVISLQEQTITVRWNDPLPRSTAFVLTIEKLVAADGGFLPGPFSLSFRTSGGPKVLSASIGSYKVSTSASITLTFDANVAVNQTLADFIRLEAGGQRVDSALTVRGNKVTINPRRVLPRCTALTVRVLDGLKNEAGISGGSAWHYNSRTLCQAVFSIGTSVEGRDITAYRFGSGPSKLIFVGTTHGDEKSSTYLLSSWIDYLEANAHKIPAHRTVTVIPKLNPDGFATARRTNAHNVDLNRNFPANNWKQGVTMPDQSFNPNGGGTAPLSEPESSALASYILAQNPWLVLTYHAAAGVVIPNDSGDSNGLAHTYDQKSNVGYAANGETDSIFHYDTTGAFEDWLHHGPSIPALLVELWTKSGNEFSKHQTAMWHLVMQ